LSRPQTINLSSVLDGERERERERERQRERERDRQTDRQPETDRLELGRCSLFVQLQGLDAPEVVMHGVAWHRLADKS
jgi:hypothetical protein